MLASSYLWSLNSFSSWKPRRTCRSRLTFGTWRANEPCLPQCALKIQSLLLVVTLNYTIYYNQYLWITGFWNLYYITLFKIIEWPNNKMFYTAATIVFYLCASCPRLPLCTFLTSYALGNTEGYINTLHHCGCSFMHTPLNMLDQINVDHRRQQISKPHHVSFDARKTRLAFLTMTALNCTNT